ncbi:MAG: alpha/beta fold hydrolase [Solirubrobacteraceae bacterium]
MAGLEHMDELDGMPVFWREAPGSGTPAVYLHGVPTSSDDWVPFLDAHGGVAPDLPGFGRTGKPGHFPYNIEGYADWLARFLEHAGVGELDLVVHDWGAVGLVFAQRHPKRVRRLVILNAVPLLPGYRWHRMARIWRTKVLGELAMGFASRRAFQKLTGLPPDAARTAYSHFDVGTQRAILRLYRSASPEALERAGENLGGIHNPALVAWGERDPFIGSAFADRYGARLPQATVEHIAGAGHWPWLDQPELVERVVAFLRG